MATIFERVGSSVLIKVGSEDPIGAVAGSFVKPDPRNADIIVISEKANPQLENEGIRVKVSDVTTPANTSRADLITKLMTDFFFRVSTPSSALATDYFYLKSEVDALMIGRVKKVLVDNTQHNNTGNTNENTVLTGTIPANSIGVNGSFHIIMLISTLNNNANAKTIRVKFNGNTVCQGVTVSTLSYQTYSILHNRNSASSQVAMYFASAASGGFATGTGTAPSTFTINTAADITVTVTIQNAVGTDTVALETIEILAIP